MLRNNLSKLKELFLKRKMAYVQTFNPNAPFSRVVLQDLAKFCRAYDSTFHKDARTSDVLEGRREVWLRIQSHIQLTSEELFELHQVRTKGD